MAAWHGMAPPAPPPHRALSCLPHSPAPAHPHTRRVIITRAWHACVARTRRHACMIRVFSAQERSVPRHVVARQLAATRDGRLAVGGRGREVADSRTTNNMSVTQSHSTNTNRARKPREAAVCLRASAYAISRAFADTIDSVVCPQPIGVLNATLSYPTIVYRSIVRALRTCVTQRA
jgi:hypothetical protein